jgi:hypothetical protein
MGVELVPVAYVALELSKKITTAAFDVENEWFFFDGAYNFSTRACSHYEGRYKYKPAR